MKITLIVVLSFLNIALAQSQELVFSKQTDLNSDKVVDKISLTQNDDITLTLAINDAKKNFECEQGDVAGFKIVDINKNDIFKEIEIIAEGPGGEIFTKLFWFDGKEIYLMNSFKGYLTIKGNGIVYADNQESFWTRRSKFTLDKLTHKLKETPQFAYYVGVENITVKNYVSIYADENLTQKTATLSKNSKITILLCKKHKSDENKDIYLIKSKSGLTGWIKYSELEKNCSGFNFAG